MLAVNSYRAQRDRDVPATINLAAAGLEIEKALVFLPCAAGRDVRCSPGVVYAHLAMVTRERGSPLINEHHDPTNASTIERLSGRKMCSGRCGVECCVE